MVSSTLRPHFTSGKDPVPIVQEAGWAPGPVCKGGKFCPHRDYINLDRSIVLKLGLTFIWFTYPSGVLFHSIDEIVRAKQNINNSQTGFC